MNITRRTRETPTSCSGKLLRFYHNWLCRDNPGAEGGDDMHYRPDEAMVDDHIMDDEDDVKGSDDSQGEDLDDNVDA